MSRSKRAPVWTDSVHGSRRRRFFKRLSNKRARKMRLQNGKWYRKNGLSYDICDYKSFCPLDDRAYRK